MQPIRAWITCGVTIVGWSIVTGPQGVQARPDYWRGFNAAYPALKEAAEITKCGICHGEQKTVRNDYGKEFSKVLGAKNIKNPNAIQAALKKAESGASSVEGKSFGDLIKEGKLPAKTP